MTPEEYREHYATHTKANSYWMRDARGIECCRVCDVPGCIETAESRYDSRIFRGSSYDDAVEEQIEDDY